MRDARRPSWLVSAALVAVLVAIVVLSFALAPKQGADEGEAFGGTDAAATEVLRDQGVEPWAAPLLNLGSAELESGLFALQAAVGAGLFGYAVGNLRGRSVARREQEQG